MRTVAVLFALVVAVGVVGLSATAAPQFSPYPLLLHVSEVEKLDEAIANTMYVVLILPLQVSYFSSSNYLKLVPTAPVAIVVNSVATVALPSPSGYYRSEMQDLVTKYKNVEFMVLSFIPLYHLQHVNISVA